MKGIPYKIHPAWAENSPDVEGAINIRGKVKPMVTYKIGKYEIFVDVSVFSKPDDEFGKYTYTVKVAGKVVQKYPKHIAWAGTAMVAAVSQSEQKLTEMKATIEQYEADEYSRQMSEQADG